MLGDTRAYKAFRFGNAAVLILLGLLCLFPVWHILAMSLSASNAVEAGLVSVWPKGWTGESYALVMQNRTFLGSFGVSVLRVALGLAVNMFFIVTLAYPLAKERQDFHGRGVYAWLLMITMIFSGGLIPTYIVIRQLGLIDSVWSLILPGAVPVWNTVLMLNFFRGLPRSIEESAFIDGAGHLTVLMRLYLPLSAPAMATIALFCIVGHWNAWFDGMIYINTQEKYPLQTFLRLISVAADMREAASPELYNEVSDKTVRCAQVFIAMVPVLCIYPFLQKFFTKGIVMGSVKG